MQILTVKHDICALSWEKIWVLARSLERGLWDWRKQNTYRSGVLNNGGERVDQGNEHKYEERPK